MVDSSIVDEQLLASHPGPLNNSQWMTTASRLLREYVSNANPSRELELLVQFTMRVYVPVWFQIKGRPNWYDGAVHLFRIIQYTRLDVPEVLEIVNKCVANNSYFAHSENILLAMIADENKLTRRKAYTRIIE